MKQWITDSKLTAILFNQKPVTLSKGLLIIVTVFTVGEGK